MTAILWQADRNDARPESQELVDEYDATGDFSVDYLVFCKLLRIVPHPSISGGGYPSQDDRERAEREAADAMKIKLARRGRAGGAKKKKSSVVQQSPIEGKVTSVVRFRGHVIDAGTAKATALALAATSSPHSTDLLIERGSFPSPEVATSFFAATSAVGLRAICFDFSALPAPASALVEPIIAPGSKVARLSLRGCGMGDEVAREILPDVIRRGTSITELDLSANGIGDSAASAIGLALRKNTTLLQVSLTGNKIGPAGAAEIATAVGKYQLPYEEQLTRKKERAEFELRRAELRSRMAAKTRLKTPATPVGIAPPSADPAVLSPGLSVKARKKQEQQMEEYLEQQISRLSPIEERGGQWIVRGNRTLKALFIARNPLGTTGKAALKAAQAENSVLLKLVVE